MIQKSLYLRQLIKLKNAIKNQLMKAGMTLAHDMGYLDEQVHNTLVFAACAVQPPTDLHENITHGQADQ